MLTSCSFNSSKEQVLWAVKLTWSSLQKYIAYDRHPRFVVNKYSINERPLFPKITQKKKTYTFSVGFGLLKKLLIS